MSKRLRFMVKGGWNPTYSTITVPDEGGYFEHYVRMRDRIIANGEDECCLDAIDLSKFTFHGEIKNQLIVGVGAPNMKDGTYFTGCVFGHYVDILNIFQNTAGKHDGHVFIRYNGRLRAHVCGILTDFLGGSGKINIGFGALTNYTVKRYHFLPRVERSDAHDFFCVKDLDSGEVMIYAGCRAFTLAEAKQHWSKPLTYWLDSYDMQFAKRKKQRLNLNKQSLAIIKLFESQLQYLDI